MSEPRKVPAPAPIPPPLKPNQLFMVKYGKELESLAQDLLQIKWEKIISMDKEEEDGLDFLETFSLLTDKVAKLCVAEKITDPKITDPDMIPEILFHIYLDIFNKAKKARETQDRNLFNGMELPKVYRNLYTLLFAIVDFKASEKFPTDPKLHFEEKILNMEKALAALTVDATSKHKKSQEADAEDNYKQIKSLVIKHMGILKTQALAENFVNSHWTEIGAMVPKNLLENINTISQRVEKWSTTHTAADSLEPLAFSLNAFLIPLVKLSNYCRKLALTEGLDDPNELSDIFTQVFRRAIPNSAATDPAAVNFIINLINAMTFIMSFDFQHDKRFNRFKHPYPDYLTKHCASLKDPIGGLMHALTSKNAQLENELPVVENLLLNYLEDFQYGKLGILLTPTITDFLKKIASPKLAENTIDLVKKHDNLINEIKSMTSLSPSGGIFNKGPLVRLAELRQEIASSVDQIESHASKRGHPNPTFTADLFALQAELRQPKAQYLPQEKVASKEQIKQKNQ